MKHFIIALCAAVPALTVAGCYGGGGAVYSSGSFGYNGYYDDYYGPIYDGYWGGDGAFYYRRDVREHAYRRGDRAHFAHGTAPSAQFHEIHGTMSPSPHMHMPHFAGAGRAHHVRGQ